MTFESEMRRGLDRISNNIKDLGTTLSSSRMPTGKAIENAGKDIANASAIQTVDLLTSAEIEELRRLIDIVSDDSFHGTVLDGEQFKMGMYEQLSDSGFILTGREFGGALLLFDVSSKAYWAVERYDRKRAEEAERKAEDEKQRKQDRRHGTFNVILGAIFGYLFSLLCQATPATIDALSSALTNAVS